MDRDKRGGARDKDIKGDFEEDGKGLGRWYMGRDGDED